MTPEQAKTLQMANAMLRSKQKPRRNSQQAISSEAQSEVTERAPNLYRVPQINVPEDLQGVSRLIQQELQKIEASQSILLSLWEKLKDQANEKDHIALYKPLSIAAGGDAQLTLQRDDTTRWNYMQWTNKADNSQEMFFGMYPGSKGVTLNAQTGSVDMYAQGGFYFNNYTFGNVNQTYRCVAPATEYGTSRNNQDFCIWLNNSGNNYMLMERGIVDGAYHYAAIVNGDDSGAVWNLEMRNNGQLYFAGALQAAAPMVEAQINMSIALTREEIKEEIYAELLALNPGIVIPSTD